MVVILNLSIIDIIFTSCPSTEIIYVYVFNTLSIFNAINTISFADWEKGKIFRGILVIK